MIRVFLPGQQVPRWLQKIEPDHIKIFFGTLVFVYKYKGYFHVKRIASFGYVFFCLDVDITMYAQGKGVIIYARPLIPDELILLVLIVGWFATVLLLGGKA